jgi:general secretion pathway protein F
MPTVRSALGHVRRMGMFFRELETLTRSGITLAAAFGEMERRAPGNLRGLAREMGSAVQSGQPVSSVMERHRDLFYPWHIGVVRAAQAGGFLPEAFDQIARAYEVEWETRSALRLRLLFYVAFGVPGVLLAIPSIMMLAEPIPRDGWTPALVVASVVRHFRTVSVPIAIGLVAAAVVWQALSATAWFQGVQQRVVLGLPIVGRAARAAALERYMAILGLMLRGGVPAGEAAEEAALAAGNVVLTPHLQGVAAALREGTPLAQTLAATRLFDGDTISMASAGEVAGSLPDMLARAAGYYRAENEAKRRMLLRVAQVTFGVIWLSLMGAVFIIAVRTYFDFAFRVYDWMLE